MRDIAGTVCFAVMIGGVSMLSIPWALILGGGLPLSLIVYGYTAINRSGK